MRARCEPKHNMPHTGTGSTPPLHENRSPFPLRIGKKDLSPLGDKESPRAGLQPNYQLELER